MKTPLKALFVEDKFNDYETVSQQLLENFELQAICVKNEQDFSRSLHAFQPDVIIFSFQTKQVSAKNILQISRDYDSYLSVIVITESQNEEIAVDCLKQGADDYLLKGNLIRLPFAITDALERNLLRKEKELAFKQLAESEDNYRRLISEMTQGMAVHDIILDRKGKPVDYRFLDMNQSFERLTGLRKEDCIGKTVLEVLPETEKIWIDKYGEVALTGQPIQFEQYSQSLDKFFEVVAYAPATGKFATIFTDTTEKVINYQRLKDNERWYRMMAENSTDVLFTTDLKLNITYISPSVEQLNGYTAEESLKQVFWDITTEKSATNLKRIFHEQLEIEQKGTADPHRMLNVEIEEIHKNGQLIIVESLMRFLRDESGKPYGIIGISRNITERKNEETRTRRRNEILSGINKLSVELTNITGSSLVELIAEKLGIIFETKAVIYNSFNLEKMTFTPVHFAGKSAKNKLISKAISKLILHKSFQIDQANLNDILNNQKLGTSYNLQEVTYNKLSHIEAVAIQKIIGKNFYVGIPVINNNKLIGSYLLVFDSNHEFVFEEEITAFSAMVSSILDSKAKSEALRQSELNYRTLIDNAHDLIIVTRNNQILFANERVLTFSGLTLEQIKQTDYLSLIHNDDRETVIEAYDELRVSGQFKNHNIRIVFKNETKWLSISAIPIEYEGQAANLTFGTDITEQKLKDVELAEEYEIRSLLFQVSNDGIVILDEDHKIFNFNNRFKEMLGYTDAELFEMHTWDFDFYNTEASIRNTFNIIRDINNIFESIHLRKDGSTYDVEVSARGFKYKQKDYVVCICRDITEQKNAAKQLKQYAESLENEQNIANMGSWEYYFKVDKMTWSNGMFKLLHLDPATTEPSNELLMGLIHPDDIHQVRKQIDDAFQTASAIHSEFRMNLTDGTFWFSANIIPIEEENKLIGFKGTTIDITSFKNIQYELAENKQQIETILEHAPVGIIGFSSSGILTSCNSYFSKIVGSSIEKLIGLNILQLPNKDVVNTFKNALEGTYSEWAGEYEAYLSGKKSVIRLTTNPLKNEADQVVGGVALIEEISERLAAEKKIRESQAQFTSSFFYSPVAMVISKFDDGSFLEVNDAWCRLSGYTREYLKNKKITDIEVIDQKQLNYIYKYLSTRGNIPEATIQIKNRKGEFLTAIASLVLYEMNEERLVLCTLIDISDRIRYENELLKLTRAVEQLPVSVVITDLQSKIEYVNPKAIETTGYTAKELIGENPRVLKSDQMTETDYKKMYEQLLQGNIWKGEFLNKRKDGSLYWESATIAPTINDHGEISHFIAIKEDISERKAMQSALKESETRYKEIFLNNPIPMWIYEVDSLKITEVNKKAIEEYGYTEEEFLQLTIKDVRPEEDIPLLLEDVKNRREAIQFATQFRHRYKDGTVIDVEITSYAIPSIDNRKMRMVLANNITDRIKARKALEEARSVAEASDKLKTHFLNNISHEVRTPLNGIMGATSLLNDPDLDRSEIPELMEIVNLSTNRLIQTITDFMDISLITSNNIEVNKKPVKLSEIIEKFRAQYSKECLDKGLSFSIIYTEEAGNMYYEIDPELITKAILHLLNNAIKFTSKGKVELGIEKSNDQIVFYVSDTGIGIAQENIPRVFQSFSQEDNSSSRRFEGSGLGLSIVKGLTELLGGTVSTESQKNVGSIFRLHFPLTNKVKTNVNLTHPLRENTKKTPLILIAEDEESNYTVLAMVMRKSFKSTVIHAVNGLEALNFVKNNPEIDVIFMDLKMPVMDGFEATAAIKKIRPELPVIAITAFAMSGDENRALSVGCDHYIAKPVSRRDLQLAMEKFGYGNEDAEKASAI